VAAIAGCRGSGKEGGVIMEISDVYNGDSLMLKNTELRGKDVFLSLNRQEQAELCVFLVRTRPQMIITAMAAAKVPL
jgi:hypothetical protein